MRPGPSPAARRPELVVRIATLWLAATAFGLAFAAFTAVGPVVLVLTSRHGVHVGDLVASAAAYALAARGTVRLRHDWRLRRS